MTKLKVGGNGQGSTSKPKLVSGVVRFNGGKIGLVYGVPLNPSPWDCLFIAHGVKSTMNSSLVSYLHSGLAARGFLTVKFNFLYSQGRLRRVRRRDPKTVLVETYKHVVEEVQKSEWKPRNIFLGGISLGAAVASHVVADGPGVPGIKGLFFLSYPIHMPGRPERLGEGHLDTVSLPMLFVSGTEDKYANPGTLKSTVSRLGTKVQVHFVEDADHGFRKGRRLYSKTLDEIADAVAHWAKTVGSAGP